MIIAKRKSYRCIIVLGIALFFASTTVLADAFEPIGTMRGLRTDTIAAINVDHTALYFCSANDVSKWSMLRLPMGRHFVEVVGGCDTGILVRTEVDEDDPGDPELPIGHVQLVESDGKLTDIASNVGGHCDFYNDQVGCQVKGGAIYVTTDKGRKWTRIPTRADENDIPIIDLAWLSPTQLIVTRSNGDVSVFQSNVDRITSLWRVNIGHVPRGVTAIGGDNVLMLAGDNDVVSLDVHDGTERNMAHIEGNSDTTGLSADLKRVCAFGSYHSQRLPNRLPSKDGAPASFIDIWEFKGQLLSLRQTLRPKIGLDAVVLLDETTSLVLQGEKIRKLAGAEIVDLTATITDLTQDTTPRHQDNAEPAVPGKPLPPPDWLPTQAEQDEQVAWSRKVPFQDFVKILQEAGSHTDLTPRQRTLFITARCKALAATRRD